MDVMHIACFFYWQLSSQCSCHFRYEFLPSSLSRCLCFSSSFRVKLPISVTNLVVIHIFFHYASHFTNTEFHIQFVFFVVCDFVACPQSMSSFLSVILVIVFFFILGIWSPVSIYIYKLYELSQFMWNISIGIDLNIFFSFFRIYIIRKEHSRCVRDNWY